MTFQESHFVIELSFHWRPKGGWEEAKDDGEEKADGEKIPLSRSLLQIHPCQPKW